VCSTIEQHAVASAPKDNYYGTNVTINLWQPMLQKANDDFSLAQLWIIAGNYTTNDLNTIEAGWQVRPQKGNDYSHHKSKSSIKCFIIAASMTISVTGRTRACE
jgi:hypothetical protein